MSRRPLDGYFRSTVPVQTGRDVPGNRSSLAVYAGMTMGDPSLVERLSTLEAPTLVLWGESDQIVDTDYGRAYAAAIPTARFQLLKGTGHMPQIETPDQLIRAIWDCADADFSNASS